MRIPLAVVLLSLGVADLVWLNVELLPPVLAPQPEPIFAAPTKARPEPTARPTRAEPAPAPPERESEEAPAIYAAKIGGEGTDVENHRVEKIEAVESDADDIEVAESEVEKSEVEKIEVEENEVEQELPAFEPLQFSTGRVGISEGDESTLERIAAFLTEHPTVAIELRGHTDRRGARRVNQRLASRRAAVVRAGLVDLGIEPERVTAVGVGASEPARRGSDAKSLAANRRVEIRLHETGGEPQWNPGYPPPRPQ